MSPIWRHPIHQRVLDAFGPPPDDAHAAALDAWARGREPWLLVEADDRLLARWAARRKGAVVLVSIARRLGTALERDALALFHAQLYRYTAARHYAKYGPNVLRAAIARALTYERDPEIEGELLVVIDGADLTVGWTLGDEIPPVAELASGVRVAVSVRSIDAARGTLGGDSAIPILHARVEASRSEAMPPADPILGLLRGALAPIPLDDLAAAASTSPAGLRVELNALAPWVEIDGDRVVLRADDAPPHDAPRGGLASFVRSASREVPPRRYVLDTLGAYLDLSRAPRAEYDALTAPVWCAAWLSLPSGPFALSWDARIARRATGDALVSGARDAETLGALVRAMLVERSALDRLAEQPGDFFGDNDGFEEEDDGADADLPGATQAQDGDGAQRAHALAAAIRTIGAADPNAAAILDAAEAAAQRDPATLLELAELAALPQLRGGEARVDFARRAIRSLRAPHRRDLAGIDLELLADAARIVPHDEASAVLAEIFSRIDRAPDLVRARVEEKIASLPAEVRDAHGDFRMDESLRAELGKARPRRPNRELIARIAALGSVDAIEAEAKRRRLYGDAKLALVEAVDSELRRPLALAFVRRVLGAPSVDIEFLFDAVRLCPWLPLDEAALVLRRTVDELVCAPSRPDLLRDAFGHDLAHLLPLIKQLGGAAAVVRVAREVIEVAEIIP